MSDVFTPAPAPKPNPVHDALAQLLYVVSLLLLVVGLTMAPAVILAGWRALL